MFESLDNQIAADERRITSMSERVWLWLLIVVISTLLFGGLYLALRVIA